MPETNERLDTTGNSPRLFRWIHAVDRHFTFVRGLSVFTLLSSALVAYFQYLGAMEHYFRGWHFTWAISNIFSPNLGAAVNPFINDGVIAPGGTSNVLTTSIAGSFTQSAAAVYALDLDFLLNVADRINATGAASVSGTIPINILNPGEAQTGAHKLTIVHGDGGLTHSNLSLSFIPSAVTT